VCFDVELLCSLVKFSMQSRYTCMYSLPIIVGSIAESAFVDRQHRDRREPKPTIVDQSDQRQEDVHSHVEVTHQTFQLVTGDLQVGTHHKM
jgi:hypothetical protein